VGDGTTSVVVMAAELLKRGADLVRSGVHPTSVIAGYRLAAREGVRFINEVLAIPTEEVGESALVNVAATTMASKVVGADGAAFARVVVDALLAVKRPGEGGGPPTYPVKGVTILKALGGAMADSAFVRGVALAAGRAAQGMPTRVPAARIACLDMNLQKARMHMGVSVVVTDPKELEAVREREASIARDRVRALLAAGANVVLTTKGIDDLCAKYFVEAGALACRRVLRRRLPVHPQVASPTVRALRARPFERSS
jgi:T-complex protein 1 subunit alpha